MEEMVVRRKKDGKRLWTVDQELHILEKYASGAPGAAGNDKGLLSARMR